VHKTANVLNKLPKSQQIGLTIWMTIRLTLALGDIRRVITGTGRRRRWSAETKAQIIAESFASEASVSEGDPSSLFGWR
jgi:hypothetical protein